MSTRNRKKIRYSAGENVECLFLGEIGWHTKAIASETGLTEGQVTYRLHQQGVRRKDYRNGTSKMAQTIVALARRPISATIRAKVTKAEKAVLNSA